MQLSKPFARGLSSDLVVCLIVALIAKLDSHFPISQGNSVDNSTSFLIISNVLEVMVGKENF